MKGVFSTKHGIQGAIAAALAAGIGIGHQPAHQTAAQQIAIGNPFGGGLTVRPTHIRTGRPSGIRAAKRAKAKRRNISRNKLAHQRRRKN